MAFSASDSVGRTLLSAAVDFDLCCRTGQNSLCGETPMKILPVFTVTRSFRHAVSTHIGIDITGGVRNTFHAIQTYRNAFPVDDTVAAAWGAKAGARGDDAGDNSETCFALARTKTHTEASA